MLSFAGGELLHGGDPLLHGIRYILAVFLFLEKGDNNDNEAVKSNHEKEKTGKERKMEMEMEMERKEDKVEEDGIENIDNTDHTRENRNKDIKLNEEEEVEMSDIFIKSFSSCYKSDPHFVLNPIKNKDLESKKKIIVDNLNSKSAVYHTETSQSTFSFGFDFIE